MRFILVFAAFLAGILAVSTPVKADENCPKPIIIGSCNECGCTL